MFMWVRVPIEPIQVKLETVRGPFTVRVEVTVPVVAMYTLYTEAAVAVLKHGVYKLVSGFDKILLKSQLENFIDFFWPGS